MTNYIYRFWGATLLIGRTLSALFLRRLFNYEIIVTHSGKFHADEISAIALWKVFKNNRVFIIRTRDEIALSYFKSLRFIFIDVGREYSVMELLFDHHQGGIPKSAAGLVLDYLDLEFYQQLKDLIKKVDDNDLGISKPKGVDYITCISRFNYSEDFSGAVSFATTIVRSFELELLRKRRAKKVAKQSKAWGTFTEVVIVNEYLRELGFFFDVKQTKHVRAIISEDKNLGQFHISPTKVKFGSKRLWGYPLRECDNVNMVFVHELGFYAIAKNKSDAVNFLIANGYS